jgi:hypothetical protein
MGFGVELESEKPIEDSLADAVQFRLELIDVLVETGMQDIVHGDEGQLRTELAEQSFSRVAEGPLRGAGDHVQRLARRPQAELDGAGEFAIEG